MLIHTRVYKFFANQVDYENIMSGNKHYILGTRAKIKVNDYVKLECDNSDTRNLFKITYIENDIISLERVR